jgi:hypothetical protein
VEAGLARDTRTESMSPAIRATRDRRLGLEVVLADLERAISAPGARRVRGWVNDTAGPLERLREAFRRHVEVTEGPGGLHDEILETSPRLAGLVDHLRDEQVEIWQRISDQLTELEELRGIEPSEAGARQAVDRARRGILVILGRIARHRQRGADLIYEAFEVDIGGG